MQLDYLSQGSCKQKSLTWISYRIIKLFMKPFTYLWNLSQTCSLFCISNKHHDIIVLASCFKTTTPSTQPQETSHDCPCWRTWTPGHTNQFEPKTSQSPRKYSVCSLILTASIFFSSFTWFLFVNLFIIFYMFIYVPFSSLFRPLVSSYFDLALRSIWGISEFQSSGSDLQVWWEKLKNASLEELRWDHSEEKIR